MARDPALDITFDMAANDAAGTPKVAAVLTGTWISWGHSATPLLVKVNLGTVQGAGAFGAAAGSGGWAAGQIITASPMQVKVRLGDATPGATLTGPIWYATPVGTNWLRWSKIGRADFTIDRSNEAGQMPLPWRGPLWQIARRGNQGPILVYGQRGVAVLQTAGTAYGYHQVLDVGLKHKLAFLDIGEAHLFIDEFSRLWMWRDGPQLLDYREWLATLTNPTLSFDPQTRLVYICDGTTGYAFNLDAPSLGKGPATYTGIQRVAGSLLVTKSGAVTVPTFQIVTDIEDFGTRKGKSIQALEVGVDSTLTLQASIDYRHNKASAFLSTNWYTIDSRGQVFIPCFGYEFRFKVKATAAGVFHLDRLDVYGVVHAH